MIIIDAIFDIIFMLINLAIKSQNFHSDNKLLFF